MSQFLMAQASGVQVNTLVADVHELRRPVDAWTSPSRTASPSPYSPGSLWSLAVFLSGDPSQALELVRDDREYDGFSENVDLGGAPGTLMIRGTTRDSAGNPLGSCVVQCFRTSDDLFVGEVTSDAAGYFELPTPYSATNHYLLAYKAGSPDVAGTTVNTLQPS